LQHTELQESKFLTEFFSLLEEALVADNSITRIKAFLKRMLQACIYNKTGFVCNSLLIFSKLEEHHPAIRTLVTSAEVGEFDDEEEHFVDVPEDDDVKKTDSDKETPEATKLDTYDPHKREPLYAHADASCLWELSILRQHYHPTVNRWAELVVKGEKIEYPGDCLADFTVQNFLDRFSFKKPKNTTALHLKKQGKTVRMAQLEPPVTSKDFLAMDDARPEEQFFLQYFRIRGDRPDSKKKKKSSGDGDGEEAEDLEMGSDDEEEAFAQKVIEGKMKDNLSEEDDDEGFDGEGFGDDDDDEDDDSEGDGDLDMDAEELAEIERKEAELGGLAIESDLDESNIEMANDQQEESSGQSEKKKKKKKKVARGFASYDEYAHLIEG